MTLQQLQQQEQELERLISENRAKQREITKQAFVEKYGADVGDTIEWMDWGETKQGVLFSIRENACKVKLLKKSGEVGVREAMIWPIEFQSIKVIEKKS